MNQQEPTADEPKKKSRRRSKANKTQDGEQQQQQQQPRPPPQASRVWVDDPTWVQKVIPAGWPSTGDGVTQEQSHSQQQPASVPSNWDDAPVKQLLREALDRETIIKEVLTKGGAPSDLPHNNQPAPATSKIPNTKPTHKPLPKTSWDSPIQGVQFLSNDDNLYQTTTTMPSTPSKRAQWASTELNISHVEAARAKLEELD